MSREELETWRESLLDALCLPAKASLGGRFQGSSLSVDGWMRKIPGGYTFHGQEGGMEMIVGFRAADVRKIFKHGPGDLRKTAATIQLDHHDPNTLYRAED